MTTTTMSINEEMLLHPYICEGCFQDVPLTERQYEQAMDMRGRLYCDDCREKRLSRATKAPAGTRDGRGGA